MNSDSNHLLDRITHMLPILAVDSSPLARDFYETALAYIKLLERFDKVIGISDKYHSDLRETSEELLKSRDEIERHHSELKVLYESIQKHEKQLRETEGKYRLLFEKTPDPILILNSMYQIIEVNRGFEKIFDYTNNDVTGKNLDDLGIGLTGSSIDRILQKMGEGSYISHKEMNLVKRTGFPFSAEVAISRIVIHYGTCLLIQIHDIHEIRQAHDAVAQVNHKLKILSSITRHDILNRIMVTSLYSEMIRDAVTDEVLQKRLDIIMKVTKEIQNLIEFTGQYQDLGATEPDWQQIDMILKYWSIQELVSGFSLSSDLVGLEIYADRMLEKVIYNLVENSVRHGQDLTSIRLSCHEEAGDMVILYEDDGGGIIAAEKEKTFKKGFGKNTGLGLFLIREILSITGITIDETGEPGVGVRFEIKVPAGKFRRLL